MRLAAARLVWALHLGVTLFVLTGWLLPWSWALWTAVILYPVVQLNWLVFGNRCALTVVEERLRRGTGTDDDDGAELHFVVGLLTRLLGRPVPRFYGDLVSYGVLWGGFTVASARLLARSQV